MAIIRESTFRANPSAGGISCNWHFAQTSETDLAFMLLFEHRGNWLQRSLSPFPLPLAHKDSDLYSTHGFLPATYFNSYHSQTLNVCVLLRRGLSEVSVRCIFLLHVRSLPWWCSAVMMPSQKSVSQLRRMTKKKAMIAEISRSGPCL